MTSKPQFAPLRDDDDRGEKVERQPDPPPHSASPKRKPSERPDPTRYGDWEKDGRCIDF